MFKLQNVAHGLFWIWHEYLDVGLPWKNGVHYGRNCVSGEQVYEASPVSNISPHFHVWNVSENYVPFKLALLSDITKTHA